MSFGYGLLGRYLADAHLVDYGVSRTRFDMFPCHLTLAKKQTKERAVVTIADSRYRGPMSACAADSKKVAPMLLRMLLRRDKGYRPFMRI
ncbi:hypothetical protein [Bradyrhizobium murdochi]|uniref:hypothetical protein n=1 Tax=Bradyrhizobium murdochi TaxID=1038859 RepID=UPI000484B003|nr:hypothetical protein [Bradyrhizobium murdochi]